MRRVSFRLKTILYLGVTIYIILVDSKYFNWVENLKIQFKEILLSNDKTNLHPYSFEARINLFCQARNKRQKNETEKMKSSVCWSSLSVRYLSSLEGIFSTNYRHPLGRKLCIAPCRSFEIKYLYLLNEGYSEYHSYARLIFFYYIVP